MCRQIVKHDDDAFLKGRGELRCDVPLERIAIHCALYYPGRRQAVTAQSGDKGRRDMPDATFLTNRILKSSEGPTIHPPKGKSNQSLKVIQKI